ncbi:MAG: hypothetical protein JWP32_2890 [Schumannella sp.]|nr:hypothetical protein [Schumannella sp.]
MPHGQSRTVISRLVDLGGEVATDDIRSPQHAKVSDVMTAAAAIGLDLGLLFHSPEFEATMALANSAT